MGKWLQYIHWRITFLVELQDLMMNIVSWGSHIEKVCPYQFNLVLNFFIGLDTLFIHCIRMNIAI